MKQRRDFFMQTQAPRSIGSMVTVVYQIYKYKKYYSASGVKTIPLIGKNNKTDKLPTAQRIKT